MKRWDLTPYLYETLPTKPKKYLVLFVLLTVLHWPLHAQTTIYVDSAATGANNGTSWTNAYNSLSDALHYCWQNPLVDSVLVAKGTYQPRHRPYDMQPNRTGVETTIALQFVTDTVFHIRTGLTVIGGYPNGGVGLPNYALHRTILEAYQTTAIYIDSSHFWATSFDTTRVIGLTTKRPPIINKMSAFKANGNMNSNHNGETDILVAKTTVKFQHLVGDISIIADSCNISIDSSSFVVPTSVPSWYYYLECLQLFDCNAEIHNNYFANHNALEGSSIRILNGANKIVHLSNNSFANDRAQESGGSIFVLSGGEVRITKNVFYNCKAHWNNSIGIGAGGAIQLSGSGKYQLLSNKFYNCFARAYGCAVDILNGSVLLRDNLFSENYGEYSAVTLRPGVDSFLCYQNIFFKNGNGILMSSAGYNEINNTFFGHISPPGGYGIFPYGVSINFFGLSPPTSIAKIKNNLFKNEVSNSNNVKVIDIELRVDSNNSSIENNFFTSDSSVFYGIYLQPIQFTSNSNNFFSVDPNFINENNLIGPDGIWMSADDGLNLNGNSPAINAGANNALPLGLNTDITGAPRIQDTIVDIGAYETNGFLTPPIINAGAPNSAASQQLRDTLCAGISNVHFLVNASAVNTTPTAVINPGNIACSFDSASSSFSFPTPPIGTYTLSVFFNYGSVIKQTDSTFYVGPPQPLVLQVMASKDTICASASVTYTAQVSGALVASYQWKVNGNNAGNNSSTFVLANGQQNDSISYSVISYCYDSINSVLHDYVKLQVYPISTISITANPSTICPGDSVALTASGGTSYIWSSGIGNGVPFVPTLYYYSVSMTDTNGCNSSANHLLSYFPVPTINISALPNDSICIGDSVMLTASGGANYVWSGNVTNGVPFVPANSGSYTVLVTDTNGCRYTATQNITLNPLPNIQVTVYPNDTICSGETVTLWATGGLATQ